MCNRKYSILWGFQHDALLIFANHVDNWYRHLRHRNSSVRIKKGFSYTPWLICFWVRKRLVLNLYVRRTNIVNMQVVQSIIYWHWFLFISKIFLYLPELCGSEKLQHDPMYHFHSRFPLQVWHKLLDNTDRHQEEKLWNGLVFCFCLSKSSVHYNYRNRFRPGIK